MNKKIISLGILFVMFVAILSSCKNDNKNDKPNDIKIEDEVKEFVYPIPTPFEITQMLQNSGTAFVIDLTNKQDNLELYMTEKSKALNLGVYGADLSYTSTYNKPQETRELLACTKKLTDELGISSMFNQNLVDRVENNMENQDSLYKIVTESYYDTFKFLNNNGKGATSVIVLAGGWIEGIFLATQLASMSMDKASIMQGLAEQKMTAKSILPLLNEYKDNSDVAEVIPLVEELKTVFDKVESTEEGLVMTEEVFEELLTTAEKLRNEIIKG